MYDSTLLVNRLQLCLSYHHLIKDAPLDKKFCLVTNNFSFSKKILMNVSLQPEKKLGRLVQQLWPHIDSDKEQILGTILMFVSLYCFTNCWTKILKSEPLSKHIPVKKKSYPNQTDARLFARVRVDSNVSDGSRLSDTHPVVGRPSRHPCRQ